MAPDGAPTPLEGTVRLGFVVPHVRALARSWWGACGIGPWTTPSPSP